MMNTHDLSIISAVRYYLNRQLRDRTLMSISKESGVPYTTLSHFADGMCRHQESTIWKKS